MARFRRFRSSRGGPVARRKAMWWTKLIPENLSQQRPWDPAGAFSTGPGECLIIPLHISDIDVSEDGTVASDAWHAQFGKNPTLMRTLVTGNVHTQFAPSITGGVLEIGFRAEYFVGLQVRSVNPVIGEHVLTMDWEAFMASAHRSNDFISASHGVMTRPSRDSFALDSSIFGADLKGRRKIGEDELIHLWIGCTAGRGEGTDADFAGIQFNLAWRFLLMTP